MTAGHLVECIVRPITERKFFGLPATANRCLLADNNWIRFFHWMRLIAIEWRDRFFHLDGSSVRLGWSDFAQPHVADGTDTRLAVSL